MLHEYTQWILENTADRNVKDLCWEYCEWMQSHFPELKIVYGHVICHHAVPVLTQHYWLETPVGEVVDPTAHQFSQVISYRAQKAGDPEPVGICYYCWNYCYRADEFCSDTCEEHFMKDVGTLMTQEFPLLSEDEVEEILGIIGEDKDTRYANETPFY
jgi:hypothetical protein